MTVSGARPNPWRGRVVRNGTTPVSAGNLANVITVARILMAPAFVALLLIDGGELGILRYVAAGLFVFAIATDAVDGTLARRRNLVTDLGKILDPIADKVLVSSALVVLVVLGELPWWVVAIILGRELGITVMRLLVVRERVIPASLAGKVKTVAQAIAVSFALVPFWLWFGDWVHIWNTVLMSAVVVLTIYSGLEYVISVIRSKPVGSVIE